MSAANWRPRRFGFLNFGARRAASRAESQANEQVQQALAQLEIAQQRFRTLEATLDNRASVVVVASGVVIAANLGQSSPASELAAMLAVFGAAFAAIVAVASIAFPGRRRLTSFADIGTLEATVLPARARLAMDQIAAAELTYIGADKACCLGNVSP
ncbi:hypothetical protein ACPW96_22955 [Micromonospora sp. DT81.3]|uniref:hypothetical protein n=1 Tax=Micromonospora sp. DT81.3 TaxID=3416523 RepID=UPI003CF07975